MFFLDQCGSDDDTSLVHPLCLAGRLGHSSLLRLLPFVAAMRCLHLESQCGGCEAELWG